MPCNHPTHVQSLAPHIVPPTPLKVIPKQRACTARPKNKHNTNNDHDSKLNFRGQGDSASSTASCVAPSLIPSSTIPLSSALNHWLFLSTTRPKAQDLNHKVYAAWAIITDSDSTHHANTGDVVPIKIFEKARKIVQWAEHVLHMDNLGLILASYMVSQMLLGIIPECSRVRSNL